MPPTPLLQALELRVRGPHHEVTAVLEHQLAACRDEHAQISPVHFLLHHDCPGDEGGGLYASICVFVNLLRLYVYLCICCVYISICVFVACICCLHVVVCMCVYVRECVYVVCICVYVRVCVCCAFVRVCESVCEKERWREYACRCEYVCLFPSLSLSFSLCVCLCVHVCLNMQRRRS